MSDVSGEPGGGYETGERGDKRPGRPCLCCGEQGDGDAQWASSENVRYLWCHRWCWTSPASSSFIFIIVIIILLIPPNTSVVQPACPAAPLPTANTPQHKQQQHHQQQRPAAWMHSKHPAGGEQPSTGAESKGGGGGGGADGCQAGISHQQHRQQPSSDWDQLRV